MEHLSFYEDEIPYGILEPFGLTQEMIEDLPRSTFMDILRGRCSPLLPISLKDENGTVFKAHTRIKLHRLDDDFVDVLFYPRLHSCPLDSYSEQEQKELRSGKAIISHAPGDESLKCFVQIDQDTNQVLYIPTPVIVRNLVGLIDTFQFDADDIRTVQSGEPVSFLIGDDKYTVGIDLTTKSGVKMLKADRAQWLSENGSDRMGKYSFGIYGCWVKDDSGDLSYVCEEDYTDELWGEQEKLIARNSAMKR